MNMNEAPVINEYITIIPTIFEVWIAEIGWIHNVFLEIEGHQVDARWVKFEDFPEGRYSLFRVEYTFYNSAYRQEARFHFSIEGKSHVCDPFIYNVTSLDKTER